MVGGGADWVQAAFPQRHPQATAADDQDRRARREAFGQQPGGGLGGSHHIFLRGRDAEARQQRGDGGRGTEGVVRHVGQPHARRTGFAQRLGRPRDGGTAQVDDPVQVEQADVVDGVEGFGTAARPLGHSGPPWVVFLARSVARTERRASV